MTVPVTAPPVGTAAADDLTGQAVLEEAAGALVVTGATTTGALVVVGTTTTGALVVVGATTTGALVVVGATTTGAAVETAAGRVVVWRVVAGAGAGAGADPPTPFQTAPPGIL